MIYKVKNLQVALNNVLIAFNDSKEVLSAFDYDTVNRDINK